MLINIYKKINNINLILINLDSIYIINYLNTYINNF